jgi:O-antigen/teichoic acid export membrane protein
MMTLGRHSLVYGVGILLSKAVSFLMLPIYTRVLQPADYGVLQLIIMTFEVVSILAGSRIAFGIFHFYHKAKDDAGRRAVLSTAVLLLSTTYAAAALAAAALAPGIARIVFEDGQHYATLVRLAAGSLACESLSLVPYALLQLRDRSRSFVIVSFVRLLLQVAFNIVFLIPLRLGVAGVLLAGLTANLLVGGFLAARLLWEVGIRFSREAARDLLRFGLPLVGMQVATFIVTFGDRYFLNRAGNTAAVGLYGLAYQFGFLVATMGFQPFQRVWDPQRFAVAKRPDRDAIYARVFIYMNVGLISAALAISVLAGDVLRIIAAPAFQSAAAFVPLIAAAYVFQCWGSFLNVGIYLKERTEYFTAANWVAAGVALAGYLLWIPRWLAWGAALATLVSLAVRAWLAHVFSQRLWPVRYVWGPVVRLSVLATVTGAAAALAPVLPFYWSVPAHLALLVIYGGLAWRLALTASDREGVRLVLQRFRNRAVRPAEGVGGGATSRALAPGEGRTRDGRRA